MKLFERFNLGLSKTAKGIKNSIGSVFSKKKIDPEKLKNFEENLILADIGLECSNSLIKWFFQFYVFEIKGNDHYCQSNLLG